MASLKDMDTKQKALLGVAVVMFAFVGYMVYANFFASDAPPPPVVKQSAGEANPEPAAKPSPKQVKLKPEFVGNARTAPGAK